MAKTLILALAALLLSSCVNSVVEQVREGATGIRKGEKLVVLGRRHKSNYETETGFISCLTRKLLSEKLSVFTEETFVDELFPWFEPRVAPLNLKSLRELLAVPAVARKFQEENIRYMIWVDGNTVTSDTSGTLNCAISPSGAGCLGFISWDQDANYEVSVWDVQTQKSVGKLASDASGTSYLPAVLVPLPLIARVQSGACKTLGKQIATFLYDDSEY